MDGLAVLQAVGARRDGLIQNVRLVSSRPISPTLGRLFSFLVGVVSNDRLFPQVSQSLECVLNRVHINGRLERHPSGDHLVHCHLRR